MYGIISFPDMLTRYHFVLVPQQENFSQRFIFFIAEFDKRDLPKSTKHFECIWLIDQYLISVDAFFKKVWCRLKSA